MGYFRNNYDRLRFPISDGRPAGFRPAQLAAVQAISTHFFNSNQPAIVTMPTGAGKTTVLMATAFTLRGERVLVLTPSRLVREQIAENFGALVDLKKIEALPLDVASPRVFATEGTIGSDEAWEDLRQYDVVVATVPSVSPRDGVIPSPPTDLFDLVLVDEAHHAPARTWSRLLDLLGNARQVLFTATPFRRDEKEIKGKLVFAYDLRRAFHDRVFGDITFQPVFRGDAPSIDIAIATATEAKFRDDRAADLAHLVMVRADSLTRAKELKEIYDRHTGLRLAFVNGQHSLAHVKRIVEKLKRDELDGIVCVNMFGEGFNLPNLKIAAVHSPHKSLAITLQFIGRFARTGQENIGGATFLAEPVSSGAEIDELYEAGAVWREIVQNLGAGRVEEEVRTREVLDSFAIEASPDMSDFSLYTVAPYFHVKIFATPDGANPTAEPDLPEKLQVIFKGVSDPHGAAVYITREAVRSPWSSDERFTNVAYDIFIFHHDAETNLLFICSSRRHAQLYNRLAARLVPGRPRPLSNSSINRVLNDLEAAEFFSVGMRKRNKLGRIESYRMIAGPSADKAIQETDGKLYDRGHCFGKAIDAGDQITIGVSTASKVWSNTYDRIPELLEWCNALGRKIASGRNPRTGSRIDLLSAGQELERVPAGVIAMAWAVDVYLDPPPALFRRADGSIADCSLLDFDLEIVDSREGSVVFALTNADITWYGQFCLGEGDLFCPASDDEPDLVVHRGNEDITISEYLNEESPSFFCSDLSAIEGLSYYPVPHNLEPFSDEAFETVDWRAAGVDITCEKKPSRNGRSLFNWLQDRLLASEAAVVFCDDGAGEMADFIAIHETPAGPRVKLYHCKASSEAQAGNRTADLYVVCGQAVKSCVWIRPDQFLARLKHRATLRVVQGYIKGNEGEALRILSQQARQQVQFDMHL
ncbi:MAG TPA: DEAD/DEAH box helicase family protein, partial [Terriglobia bacterium]|nr:DEAD/DEAH box helicase family protein [Terriglobia bacterium]